MLVSTTTECGCSASRSGSVASVSLVSSMLTSLPTTKNGTVGNRRCRSRNTWLSTMPLPVPASNTRSAGGRGTMWPSSRPIRAATSAFSLVVITNSRYFSRLSKNRKGSAFAWLADLVSTASMSVIATPVRLAEPYREHYGPNITVVRAWRTHQPPAECPTIEPLRIVSDDTSP